MPANEVVYGGLRPGTAYQAEVKAIFNDTGLGKLSAKANVQTQLLDKGSFPLGVRLEVHSFKRELKATKPNQSFSNKKWNPLIAPTIEKIAVNGTTLHFSWKFPPNRSLYDEQNSFVITLGPTRKPCGRFDSTDLR